MAVSCEISRADQCLFGLSWLSTRSSTAPRWTRSTGVWLPDNCTRLANSLRQTVDASKFPTLVGQFTQQSSCIIHQWFRSKPDKADGSTPHHSRQKTLIARTCLLSTTIRASPQYPPALCRPLAWQMPCPWLEASTWSAKEYLDTTGRRGSQVHNRLAVVIGTGSLLVEVPTALAGQTQQSVSECPKVGFGVKLGDN